MLSEISTELSQNSEQNLSMREFKEAYVCNEGNPTIKTLCHTNIFFQTLNGLQFSLSGLIYTPDLILTLGPADQNESTFIVHLARSGYICPCP